MAATLTREQMFAEIVRQDEAKVDLVADTRRMSAVVAPLSEQDGESNEVVIEIDQPGQDLAEFVLNDHAKGQISSDLGIPKRYFDRMLTTAPDLLKENVTHWLYNESKRKLVRGFKGEDGGLGVGRAWLSDRYRRMDNIEIARKIFPVFEEIDGLTFHQSQLTDTRFYVRALLPSLQREIAVGDIVQAGVAIRNSEVGAGMLTIEPFMLRLICLNGMTVPDHKFGIRHVGRRIEDESVYSSETLQADDNAFWLMARDQVKNALTEVRFEEIVAVLAETIHGDKIEAPAAATETLAQKFGLTDGEREAVLRNLTLGSDLSQWGLLNAVTATAKEAESFDRQAEMEEMGWDIATLPTREWAKIAVAS